MYNKLKFLIAFLIVPLVGCSNQIFNQNFSTTSDIETLGLNIEKQLQVITDNYEWKCPQSDYVRRMFSVTDLDQNGRLELIVSRLEGTGWYTYSDYYEVNKELNGLTLLEGLSGGDKSQADIMTDKVSVYYDSHNQIYYYIYDDLIKDGIHYSYENKRALSLIDGKLSERLLAYKNTYYNDVSDSSASISCKDADGNEIGENEYDLIDEIIFTDFIKKEACFFWFDANDLNYGNLSDNEIGVILQKSYNGFLIQ